jgi:hypothetical protein
MNRATSRGTLPGGGASIRASRWGAMASPPVFRGLFEQLRLDMAGRVIRAALFPDSSAEQSWLLSVGQPGVFTIRDDGTPFEDELSSQRNREFTKIATSAASALLGYRGSNSWMKWLDEIAARKLGDLVETSPIVSREMEGGRIVGEANLELVTVVDCALGSILLCDELYATLPAHESQSEPASPVARVLSNSERVDAFLSDVERVTGKRPQRQDIWRACKYGEKTEFERWQRSDARATPTAKVNFERVLGTPPAQFVADLERRGLASWNQR